MSDFEHEFRPETIPGVLDIETLGLSPHMLGQLQPEDARFLLLAMGKSLQTVAHPDRANTHWTGPEVSQITYATQVLKNLGPDEFAHALKTYIDNASVIRESAFIDLRDAKHDSEVLNMRLGEAVLGIVADADSVYAHTNGVVFSRPLWTRAELSDADMTEALYKLVLDDGVVRHVDRIERVGKLVEHLPNSLQQPLRDINEELQANGGEEDRVIVVAQDGRVYAAPDRYNRQILVKTDFELPLDEAYPLAGSYIHLKDARAKKDSNKTKLGAHIFSDNGAIDDAKVQRLAGAKYIGHYTVDPDRRRTDMPHKELDRVINAQDLVDESLFRHGILSDDDLAVLIANGFMSLKRRIDSSSDYGRMTYRMTKKSKNIAFLPGELLTIN